MAALAHGFVSDCEIAMSRHNKVNPDHYKVAGRLSTDDLARERRNQNSARVTALRDRSTKPMPPWMTRHDEPRTEEQAEPTQAPAPVGPPAGNRPAGTRSKARSSRKPVARTAAATKAKTQTKAKPKTKAKTKAKAKASREPPRPPRERPPRERPPRSDLSHPAADESRQRRANVAP